MPPFPSAADLRGGARLTVSADLTEAVHATIARPFGRRQRTRGIAGWAYRAVRWTARATGGALDRAFALAERRQAMHEDVPAPGDPARDAVVAALNGVLGDTLAAEGNALATPLHFRYAGHPLTLDSAAVARAVPDPSATLLVLVHGLCMHDAQWGDDAHDPGNALAQGLDATLVPLRYNSGRHISENGRAFAEALDALVRAWPRPVRRLVVVGHSMGGLVARSAFHYAAEAGHDWPGREAALVTLGSPHHGSPLERLGNGVDALLDTTRYTAPFARIGRVRSAGVTDLRFGNVRDEDWAGRGRFVRAGDARRPLPLPDGVACYLVAATTGNGRGGLRDRTIGDGLVPLDSALGRHPGPAFTLAVPTERQWTAAGMTHLDLLRSPAVTARLLAWLAPPERVRADA